LQLSPGSKVYNTPDYTAYNPGLVDSAVIQGIHVPADGYLEVFPEGGLGTGQYDLLNFSTALLNNRTQHKQARYGALFGPPASEAQFGEDGKWELSVLTNISAVHGLPTWANIGMQALLRNVTGDPSSSSTVYMHPFAWTPRQRTAIQSINGVVASIVVSLAFTFIPASFAVFVVSEREHKSKHLQLISGVSMTSYWAANYLWDFCAYVIPASLSAAIIYAYQNPSLVANMDVLLANFLAYGLSIIPFTYLCSFLFESHSTAQNVMIMVRHDNEQTNKSHIGLFLITWSRTHVSRALVAVCLCIFSLGVHSRRHLDDEHRRCVVVGPLDRADLEGVPAPFLPSHSQFLPW
jgi:hypothetical protein